MKTVIEIVQIPLVLIGFVACVFFALFICIVGNIWELVPGSKKSLILDREIKTRQDGGLYGLQFLRVF